MQVANLAEYGVDVLKPIKGGVHVVMWKENFERMIEDSKKSDGRVLINDLHYDFINYKIIDDTSNPVFVDLYLVKIPHA